MRQASRPDAPAPQGKPKQAPGGTEASSASHLNIGSFRFWFVGQRWEWSDEVARMHGYEPGAVVPTTKLLPDEALPDLFENRAAIEQAKGVLMFVYRVSAEQAFRVLQWRSQETNTKLRALAKQLLAEVATLPPQTAAFQSQIDHLLLTAHERIPAESAEG